MSPDYQFVYKLWLSKHLPWITDIAYYFTHMVCRNFVAIIKKPFENKNFSHIDDYNIIWHCYECKFYGSSKDDNDNDIIVYCNIAGHVNNINYYNGKCKWSAYRVSSGKLTDGDLLESYNIKIIGKLISSNTIKSIYDSCTILLCYKF